MGVMLPPVYATGSPSAPHSPSVPASPPIIACRLSSGPSICGASVASGIDVSAAAYTSGRKTVPGGRVPSSARLKGLVVKSLPPCMARMAPVRLSSTITAPCSAPVPLSGPPRLCRCSRISASSRRCQSSRSVMRISGGVPGFSPRR